MNRIKTIFILAAVLIGFNANSQEFELPKKNNVQKIVLFDGRELDIAEDVSRIHTAMDRENKVDYIELTDGMIVDSYDIEGFINFSGDQISSFAGPTNIEGLDSDVIFRLTGDGSGGRFNLRAIGDGSGAGFHSRSMGDGSGAGFGLTDMLPTVLMARGDGSGG